MRGLTACFLLFLSLGLLSGITVTAADYGFANGKIRNFSEGPWNSATTDLTSGSGKSWSFSLPTTGYINNTYHSVSGITGFPTANLSATYSQYLLGYLSTGTIYYQNNGTDILNLGYSASPNMVWNPAIPNGLPHFMGKTWQGTHAWQYGSYTINGEVISEGQLSTPLGSFAAICVRYYYQNNVNNYYTYQWETKEYGITAYAINLNDGMLYVLNQAEQNVAIHDPELSPSSLDLSFGPNPFRDELQLSIKSTDSSPAEVSIFNLKGQLIRHWKSIRSSELLWDGRDASSQPVPGGVYLIRITQQGQVCTKRVLKL